MRTPRDIRVLVVDASVGAMHVARSEDFAGLFDRGDLLVVNDAATLPASLQAGDVEVRLLGALGDRTWSAALLGRGDWQTRTEDRPPPPAVEVGQRLGIGAPTRHELVATILRVHPESPRLVTLELSTADGTPSLAALWAALYRVGRPVQYAHVPAPYALWDVQNAYAGRPWAVEMPSAGRILTFEALAALRRRGVEIATLTHAAGLSSVGDAAIDAMLPMPERFEIPRRTWDAVERTRARGGRVIAIGTSVVRALESAAQTGALAGITDLKISAAFQRAAVDAVLTGVHETDTSHFALLGAFADRGVLDASVGEAESASLIGHEMGDVCLVWAAGSTQVVHRSGAQRVPIQRSSTISPQFRDQFP